MELIEIQIEEITENLECGMRLFSNLLRSLMKLAKW